MVLWIIFLKIAYKPFQEAGFKTDYKQVWLLISNPKHPLNKPRKSSNWLPQPDQEKTLPLAGVSNKGGHPPPPQLALISEDSNYKKENAISQNCWAYEWVTKNIIFSSKMGINTNNFKSQSNHY